jgi:predicted DNA-binding transcriptional regulator YafY
LRRKKYFNLEPFRPNFRKALMTSKGPRVSPRIRRERILSYLEGAKQPRSLTQITEHLNTREDWNVNRKTVERDIDYLTSVRSIEESEGHPKGFYIRNQSMPRFPLALTKVEVHTLSVALALLSQQSPRFFRPLVESLETAILKGLPSPFNRELETFISRCVARGAASGRTLVTNETEILSLLQALREERMVTLTYTSPYDLKEPRRGVFGLVMLEVFGGSYYMLVEDLEEANTASRIKRLALPRISKVHIEEASYKSPSASRLKSFEASYAGLGGDNNPVSNVKIRCGKFLGKHLEENQIHPSQRGKKLSAEAYEYEFSLPIGLPFVRLLTGFAFDIDKLEPLALKNEVDKLLTNGRKSLSKDRS